MIKDGYIMIKNLCDLIEVYCDNGHAEPIAFYMKDGSDMNKDSFYACPKYYPENRTEHERACNNNLTITDYLKMVDYIDKKITEAELNDEKMNLTNYKFKIGMVQYRIIEHSEKKIKVAVLNKRAINK